MKRSSGCARQPSIVAFDLDDAKRKEVSTFGAAGVSSLKDLVAGSNRRAACG